MKRASGQRGCLADIESLKIELGLRKQSEFAKALGFSESSVSFWLRGDKRRPPSVEAFLRMAAKTQSRELAASFLRHARIDPSMIDSLSLKLSVFRDALPVEGDTVRIPRYRYTAEGREEAGPPVPLPAEFIPNPASTICFVVDVTARGVVNAPRGTFIVDTSVEDAQELTALWEKAVLLDFQLEDRSYHKGLYAGRLVLRQRVFYIGYPGQLAVHAHLNMLSRGGGLVELPIGEWRHPQFDQLRLQNLVGQDGVIRSAPPNLEQAEVIERCQRETEERAPVEFRLPGGIRILGQVIGRLSGNVK